MASLIYSYRSQMEIWASMRVKSTSASTDVGLTTTAKSLRMRDGRNTDSKALQAGKQKRPPFNRVAGVLASVRADVSNQRGFSHEDAGNCLADGTLAPQLESHRTRGFWVGRFKRDAIEGRDSERTTPRKCASYAP